MADGNISLSNFATVLGAVIKRTPKEILQTLYTDNDVIIKDCRTIKGIKIDQYWSNTKASITEVAQGWYGAKFTHKGNITLDPSKWLQYGHKLNTKLIPTDIIGNHIGEDFWDESKELKMQPFVEWAWKELILKQHDEDHIEKQLYAGVYVDHTATPTIAADAADAMNGIQHILANGDDSGNHIANVLTAIGALSDDPVTLYAQIQAAVKLIAEKYRFNVQMGLYMSPGKQQLYWEGREKTIGARVITDDLNRLKVPNTNISMKGSNSMIGTDDLFITPKRNLLRLIDKKGFIGSIDLQVMDYEVKILSSVPFALRYAFSFMEEVWTNVPAGGWGSGSGSGS